MNIIQTILVAFSMFSSLPVPFISWTEKNTKYMLLAFPLVGLLCGFLFVSASVFFTFLNFSNLFQSVFLVFLPILLTGGIHLDGYADTLDAQSCHQTKEKKLEILSDPHVGLFAVLGLISYLFLFIAVLYELEKTTDFYPFFFCVFVISRCISGILVVQLPSAKKTGLANTFGKQAEKKWVTLGLLCYLFLCFFYLMRKNSGCTLFLLVSVFLVLAHWFLKIYQEYQGITGDLSGYLSQKIEFYSFVSVLLFQKVSEL